HDGRADLAGRHLLVATRLHEALDVVHDLLELARRDGPLLARAAKAGQELGAVEELAALVLLHDVGRDFLEALVRGEAAGALSALAPAADGVAVRGLARVHDTVLGPSAVGTAHRSAAPVARGV